MKGRHVKPPVLAAISVAVAVGGLVHAPVAHAEDLVTYEIFSSNVGQLAALEYRDTSGKHRLQAVPLPWKLTVPVADATSPTGDGAELRADWRPPWRTAATVGRVLQGLFVTVRISKGDETLCESVMDVGNVTCYGSVPHTAENKSSPGNLP